MSIYAIETDRLTKRYGEVLAVQSVDLRVKQGEIYGFLGLNGAGKTTTIRALLGMICPSEGRVRILGQEIDRGGRGPWAQVGHLVESPSAYPELSVHENLEVAQSQSYGPEARGGACRSDVVISDEPIDYTKPLALDMFVALSPAAAEKYWPEVQEGKTLVLVDKTLVPRTPDHAPPVLGIEATRIAEEELKDRLAANMIMLGAMAAVTGWVSLKALEETLSGRMSAKALDTSKAALRRGFELGMALKAKD